MWQVELWSMFSNNYLFTFWPADQYAGLSYQPGLVVFNSEIHLFIPAARAQVQAQACFQAVMLMQMQMATGVKQPLQIIRRKCWNTSFVCSWQIRNLQSILYWTRSFTWFILHQFHVPSSFFFWCLVQSGLFFFLKLPFFCYSSTALAGGYSCVTLTLTKIGLSFYLDKSCANSATEARYFWYRLVIAWRLLVRVNLVMLVLPWSWAVHTFHIITVCQRLHMRGWPCFDVIQTKLN